MLFRSRSTLFPYTTLFRSRYVGILVDLPGPKVRAATFGTDPVSLVEDTQVKLRVGSTRSDASNIEVDYEGLLADVEPGDRLSMGDGRVILEILDADGDRLTARVAHGGVLNGRPGLHIPSDRLSMRAPTEDDLRAVERFVELDVDMIALSFVRSAEDLARLPVAPHPEGPLVVAKIETRAAIDDLPAIIAASGASATSRSCRSSRRRSSGSASPWVDRRSPPPRCSRRW